MSGILPDTKQHADAAEKIRHEAVMLAARDAANQLTRLANALRALGCAETEIFEGEARTFRKLESSAADKMGEQNHAH